MVNLRLFIMVITNKSSSKWKSVSGGWVCEEGVVLVFCQRRNSKILRRASQVKLVSVPSSLDQTYGVTRHLIPASGRSQANISSLDLAEFNGDL